MLQLQLPPVIRHEQNGQENGHAHNVRLEYIEDLRFISLNSLWRIQFKPVIKDQVSGHNKIQGAEVDPHIQHAHRSAPVTSVSSYP